MVKLLDHGLAQHLRQLSLPQLRNKINVILRDSPELKDIKVAAAHQLESGDVTIITNSLEEGVGGVTGGREGGEEGREKSEE